jgi:hypothetical protein
MSILPADPKTQLIAAVRGFVHMDNLTESFSRQAHNARQLRVKHEAEAIALMKLMGISHSTLKISGGTLQLAQKRAPASLSWTFLEREVPAWATSNGISTAQAASLLRWLQDHRDIRETEFLKKSLNDIKTPSTR